MSEKQERRKRVIMSKLRKRALLEYFALSFWEKLKWKFNKDAFVKHYIEYNKESYFNFWNQFYQ